jgi:glycine hydroxymethyltransferase
MEEDAVGTLIRRHEELKQTGINLVASENRLSERAARALASDLAGRYDSDWYGGTRHARDLVEHVENLARTVFSARHAFVTPLSGNMCDLAVLFAFTKAGDSVAGIPWEHGGYPFGYGKFERQLVPLPMRDYVVDAERLGTLTGTPLLLLAPSVVLFPHPVRTLAACGAATFVYDASHVLGLVAGGAFQQPLSEGADVVIGSTHKSLPGPQGGIVATNDDTCAERLAAYLRLDIESGIGLVDNPHVNRIAALGLVLQETRARGRDYARAVVDNARALAAALDDLGIPVKYRERAYTDSHQVLLDLDVDAAADLFEKLERNNIFIDRVARLGVAEVTKVGMQEAEMADIAHLIADAAAGRPVKERAEKLAVRFYL